MVGLGTKPQTSEAKWVPGTHQMLKRHRKHHGFWAGGREAQIQPRKCWLNRGKQGKGQSRPQSARTGCLGHRKGASVGEQTGKTTGKGTLAMPRRTEVGICPSHPPPKDALRRAIPAGSVAEKAHR